MIILHYSIDSKQQQQPQQIKTGKYNYVSLKSQNVNLLFYRILSFVRRTLKSNKSIYYNINWDLNDNHRLGLSDRRVDSSARNLFASFGTRDK